MVVRLLSAWFAMALEPHSQVDGRNSVMMAANAPETDNEAVRPYRDRIRRAMDD